MILGGVTYSDGDRRCVDGPGYDYRYDNGRYYCRYGTTRIWRQSDADQRVNNSGAYGIEYYPATFYLPDDQALPPDYGWAADADTIEGRSPDGAQDLIGYEIRRDNFIDQDHYQDAIQNFANWFVYYRKRHLATRGGITASFSGVSKARVGSCTINDRDRLVMRDLTDDDDRAALYRQIYSIDYDSAQGTPNRAGLRHLGEQLETRSDLITSPCQQHFAILFTDGFNTGAVSGFGNADEQSEALATINLIVDAGNLEAPETRGIY